MTPPPAQRPSLWVPRMADREHAPHLKSAENANIQPNPRLILRAEPTVTNILKVRPLLPRRRPPPRARFQQHLQAAGVVGRHPLPPCAGLEESLPALSQSLPRRLELWSSPPPSLEAGGAVRQHGAVGGASSPSPARSARSPSRSPACISPPSPGTPPVSASLLLLRSLPKTFCCWLCCPCLCQLFSVRELACPAEPGAPGFPPSPVSPAGPCSRRPHGMALAADQLCPSDWSCIAAPQPAFLVISFLLFSSFSVDHGCGSLQIPRGLAGGPGSHAVWEEPGPAAGGGSSNGKAEILRSEVHQVSVHLDDAVPERWGERAAPSLCPRAACLSCAALSPLRVPVPSTLEAGSASGPGSDAVEPWGFGEAVPTPSPL